jgi:hypothetical protein
MKIGVDLISTVFILWYYDRIREWEGKRENDNKVQWNFIIFECLITMVNLTN